MTKDEYLILLQEIQKHNKLYFQKSQPEITDYEYDLLVKKVEKLEEEHPEWVPEDTPTKRVGEMPTKGFSQVKHEHPMLSLSNTYSKEEVADFIKRVDKNLEGKKVNYCVELKVDGVAISLHYVEGRLLRGVTRGNGKRGDDITINVKTIRSIPHELKEKVTLEVRGEVFIPKHDFIEMNREREEAGDVTWANPRNAAAGSLKLLDHTEVAKRKLDIVVYNAIGSGLSFQSEIHAYLKKLGLPVGNDKHFQVCRNVDEIFAFAELENITP